MTQIKHTIIVTKRHTKLQPLGEILVVKVSHRVQMDEVYYNKLLSFIQKQSKFCLYMVVLDHFTKVG